MLQFDLGHNVINIKEMIVINRTPSSHVLREEHDLLCHIMLGQQGALEVFWNFWVCRRRDNLNKRSQDKQKKKIERRENKLMRPGFEGRRATTIN